MMELFTICDRQGRVLCAGRGDDPTIRANLTKNDHVFRGVEARPGQYVALPEGEIRDCPEMPVTIAGLRVTAPVGAGFRVYGPAVAEGVVDETGVLEFVFEVSGVYRVELEAFPYLPKEVVLHVGARKSL